MRIQVLFFASYRDIVGDSALELNLPAGASVLDCATELKTRYPKFAAVLPRGRVAVNLEIVEETYVLKSGDEVAFMPPMSGG